MTKRPLINTSLAVVAGLCALAALAAYGANGAPEQLRVRAVATPPMTGSNRFAIGNRSPLTAEPLLKLPIGSIRPEGWLRKQLDFEADGFSGRLDEISAWCKFEGSAWSSRSGQGRNGWEELPYWLKGYVDLGYVVKDRRIIANARRWIDAILAGQRPDGWFGPEANRATPDIWPNMLALYALRSHFEATGDPRVIPFMKRYFRFLAKLPQDRFLPGDWQKWRGGDNLDSIYWLYNRTGEPWLLDLARINHERTADWAGSIPTWHGVNLSQGFREPAEYYQQTRDPKYFAATVRNYDTIIGLYGQVPGGMFGADENARPGYNGPRQAAETCSMVEMMYSHELLLRISGDPTWGDRCEDVAFNSLPASMTPDLKGLHYLTSPNMVQLDRQSKDPMLQNGGDMLSYDPGSYRCCQHNAAFGWPYFAEHLWMATRDNGLAAALYAPCSVKARVAGGAEVHITESTEYPFHESIRLKIDSARPTRFPLYLRIPGWCSTPQLTLNGKSCAVPTRAKGWLVVDRTWKAGEELRLTLPMAIRVKTWTKNRGTVSVYRGPLAFSLKIRERWQRYGGTDRWPAFEVFPESPWNYGLALKAGRPEASFKIRENPSRDSLQPFTPATAPIEIVAQARRIPEWKLESNGLVGEVQPGPIRSSEPVEQISLIPMGCARLRISAFPQIRQGPEAIRTR